MSTTVSDAQSVRPSVVLGTGPPTREELAEYYPAKFTWEQLKLFVNSGDLGLLKRDKALQKRYDAWAAGVKTEHGSIVDYLLNYRLQWGKPDRVSLMTSEIEDMTPVHAPTSNDQATLQGIDSKFREETLPEYFTADISPRLICIIQNDWPYSVPLSVEHTLIWTKVPILPPPTLLSDHVAASLSPELLPRVTARLAQDGLWGFTGLTEPPPSPSLLPQSLGALSEWGITIDKLIVSPKGSTEEEAAVKLAGIEVQKFVARRWDERDWETAWFVNPPRLQSVKGLAHIHVFARKKN